MWELREKNDSIKEWLNNQDLLKIYLKEITFVYEFDILYKTIDLYIYRQFKANKNINYIADKKLELINDNSKKLLLEIKIKKL